VPLSSLFIQLDHCLQQTRAYWQCVAFDYSEFPWCDELLNNFLNELSDEQVRELDADQTRLYEVFADFIPAVEELSQLTSLPYSEQQRADLPFWLSNGIKGRKLLQLQDFVSHLDNGEQPVLEWCAGKGHLGRILAHQGAQHVQSVELQANLCEQGQHSAKQQSLNMHFRCADVLQDNTDDCFTQQQHAVALHACGRLHQVFMQQAIKAECDKISLSPCCYHLFTEPTYEAMSTEGKQSTLQLTHSDMKLALQETVTAPSRVTKVRQTEVTWRLGFDALRREVTGIERYVSVPSINKQIFSGEFADFCQWAAEQKQVELPESCDYQHYLRLGEQRKKITDRIELVRHIFRRAIELWLVLDRALYLQQAGYDVQLSEFCEKSLTPRNILIQANKITN